MWGNTQSQGSSISTFFGGVVSSAYSDIDSTITGTGNINNNPLFSDTIRYVLKSTSPCIDAGDPSSSLNDPASSPTAAIYPAQGTARNDMGAYGGPLSAILAFCPDITTGISPLQEENNVQLYPNPANQFVNITLGNNHLRYVELYDISGRKIIVQAADSYAVRMNVSELSPGTYILKLFTRESKMVPVTLMVIKP